MEQVRKFVDGDPVAIERGGRLGGVDEERHAVSFAARRLAEDDRLALRWNRDDQQLHVRKRQLAVCGNRRLSHMREPGFELAA
jgi:hypothetical protein